MRPVARLSFTVVLGAVCQPSCGSGGYPLCNMAQWVVDGVDGGPAHG